MKEKRGGVRDVSTQIFEVKCKTEKRIIHIKKMVMKIFVLNSVFH